MFASDRIIALDVGASKLVLAEFLATKAGTLELSSYAITPLEIDPDSDADLPAFVVHAIRQVVREKSIRPGPVLMSISGQMVFPRTIKLPPVPKDKIAQMVKYEAQQNVPFAIDEVVWDYQLIGDQQGELSVMLVAVKRDLVQKLTDCVEGAGLEPEIVDVAPLALYNAARYNYPELSGCTMILDIGARTSNVVFAEGNRIFIRSIPVAGHAITKELMKEFDLPFKDAEQLKLSHSSVGSSGVYDEQESGVAHRVARIARNVMGRLHMELIRTINFYRSQQGGTQPTLLLLSGGGSIVPNTDVFFRDKLKIDVDYLNSFRNVSVGTRIPSDSIGRDVQLLGEVVGLALRRVLSCPIEINLLPPELAARKVFHKRLPFFGMAALGLVLIMIVWWAYLYRMQGVTRERLSSVKARVNQLSTLDRQLAEMEKQKAELYGKTRRLVDLVALRTRWIEILSDLHGLMPSGMWLVSLEPAVAEDGSVSAVLIRGMGFSDKVTLDTISEFVGRVKTVRHFTDKIEIRSIKPVSGTDYVNEFVINVALKPNTL